ncbi:MAG: hypothetical protein M4579_002581 [Chaenotheca gracillima]|nr:MAG: hypothetical protein M4579_002581 [Chaenotheca gracillima]
MNEVFELPAEANPLTSQNLYNALQAATSPYQQQVQTGTQQLQAWEKEKGFYSSLQSVFLNQTLPLDVRYLSIIQLKNGIDKYWRKTAQNAVTKDEKALIRSRILEAGIAEANWRLALQNALVVAKIVRFEFPNDWPDVITSLVALIRSSAQGPAANPLYLQRGLLLLLHIVKELSTARLQRSRVSLQSVTPEIVFVLGGIYVDKVRRWRDFLENGGEDEGGALEAVDQSLLAIKVLRRLLISGYEFPQRESDVQQFWGIIKDQLSDLLNVVSQQSQSLSSSVVKLVEKHLLQFSKLHVDMAKYHPAAFVLLPGSIELARAYWGFVATYGESYGSKAAKINSGVDKEDGDDEDSASVAEKLSLKGLILLRSCVKMVFNPTQTFKFRKAEEKEEQKQATERIKAEFFEEGQIRQIMETIVSRFFVFREIDLREWEAEPEEWERKEDAEGEGWEFSIRLCAEKLFLDLMINFKSLLVEPLLTVFFSVSKPENEDILLKDSVYTAIGLSAAVLHHELDFNTFLTSTLVQEVQKEIPGCNILRRRIAILLGQWVSVNISIENRPLLYQIFQHLLSPANRFNDKVVRITAARQFKSVVDEWDFEADAFGPYAPPILESLMALIEEVESTETKLVLLNSVSIVVERLEHRITPFAEKIVSLLPPLWEQSGEEHLLKQAILTILTRLITSMKQESRRYHSMVLPLIKYAIEPGSESQVYLLEDALDLWAAVLTQTPDSAAPDILPLAQYLFPIFDQGTENLRKALDITESYLLLAPSGMLETEMRNTLFRSFIGLLENVKAEFRGMITRLIEILIRSTEKLGGEEALRAVAASLVETGLLAKLMDDLKTTWDAHQTIGPNKRHPPLDVVVETDYLNVLARLMLGDLNIALLSLQASRSNTGEDIQITMIWLLSEWFSHFENIGHPANRKLHALALTTLLETGEGWVLSKLQDIMTVWTDVVTELQEGSEDRGGDNLVYWNSADSKTSHPEAPEDDRHRQLLYQDAVHRINVNEFVRHHLQTAIQRCGGQEVFEREWLAAVDKDIISSFGKLGIM